MAFAPPTDRSRRTGSRAGSVRSAAHSSVFSRSSSMSRLSNTRLEKLRDLHTRALLGDTLKHKLQVKHKNKIPEDVLQAEIDRITAIDKGKVTAADLQDLEARVKAKAAEYPTPRSIAASSRPATAMSAAARSVLGDDMEDVLPVTESKVWGSFAKSTSKPLIPPKPKLTPRSKANEEWVLVMKHENLMAEEAEKEAKQAKLKERSATVEYLASQLKEKEERAELEKADRLIWAAQYEREVAEAADTEKAQADARRAVALREKQAREEQMQYRIKRKELEAKAQAKYERDMIDRVQREAREAEEKAAAAKAAERIRYRKIFDDNAAELERRRQAELREAEEDRFRMQEYARVMEEQERKRNAYWEEFAEKQKKLAEAKVQYEQQDTGPRVLMSDEVFAEKEAQRQREEEEALARKIAKKKAADAECRSFIKEQLRRKEEERAREALLEKERAARAALDLIQAEKEEAERDMMLRRKAQSYRDDLVKQISSRTAESNRASAHEVALNKAKFEAAKATFRK